MSAGAQVIPIRQDVNALWESYQDLAQQALDRPELTADRDHCEAMMRAHRRWADAFLATERLAR